MKSYVHELNAKPEIETFICLKRSSFFFFKFKTTIAVYAHGILNSLWPLTIQYVGRSWWYQIMIYICVCVHG